MISIQGKWFDGKSSAQVDAVLKVGDNGAWELQRSDSGQTLLKQSRSSLRVSARLANTPRYLNLSEDGSFETLDNEGVDAVLAMLKRNHWSLWVHLLESRMRYVLVAVVLAAVMAYAGTRYGVPAAARIIAENLPESVLRKAGEQTLTVFDKVVFKPSEIDPDREDQLRSHLQSVIGAHPGLGLTIELRKGGPIGPNAFALPSGHIIFTDEMIAITRDDNELLAVLVHEIGHVVHRHGMRRLVQDSLLSFAILAVTGDVSGVSELFLGLPVILTELKYSREFEGEADRYALEYLRSNGIPPHHFADLMQRITSSETSSDDHISGESEGGTGKWTSYLSTHPATHERIKLFLETDRPKTP